MSDSMKDRFLKKHELSDEELEKVTGGIVIISSKCPNCNTALGRWVTFTYEQQTEVSKIPVKCPNCGWQDIVYNSYVKNSYGDA